MTSTCPLCTPTDEEVIYLSDLYRIIAVNDPAWPGFCRVILNAHRAEMTDLTPEHCSAFMKAVFATESVLRELSSPDKINLASLGNVVPHVHWHVIPRWQSDSHFPDPIWTLPQRPWVDKPRINSRDIRDKLKTLLS